MKRVISLLFLTFILGLTQTAFARPEEAAKAAKDEKQVQLREGQQKTVPGSRVKVRFLSVVEDSRCPADVQCIWAGNAKIRVKVSVQGGETRILELNTNTKAAGNNVDAYAINLVSLTPYPRSDRKARGVYRATISVNKLSR